MYFRHHLTIPVPAAAERVLSIELALLSESLEEVNVGEVLRYLTLDCDGEWSRCIRTTNRPDSTEQKLPLKKKQTKDDANLCTSSKLFPWSSVNLCEL